MVTAAAAYPWSSYRCRALGRADPLLTPHATYTALAPTASGRQKAYRALFDQGLDDDLLEALRDATNRGWVPGSGRFQSEIAKALGRRVTPPRRGRPPKAAELELITGVYSI